MFIIIIGFLEIDHFRQPCGLWILSQGLLKRIRVSLKWYKICPLDVLDLIDRYSQLCQLVKLNLSWADGD